MGSRSIIYNRIAAPDLLPQPAPVETSKAVEAAYVPTAEEMAAVERWQQMHQVTLFLSCTVYDDALTEVRVWHGQSETVFWTTINFHYLSQITHLETATTSYFILMGLGDSTREEFERQNSGLIERGYPELVRVWPNLTPSGESEFLITSDPASTPPEILQAIQDLHTHFDANREALMAGYTEREAERLAREEWLKANPPQPKDTTIEFFPIQSTHSATEAKVSAPNEDSNFQRTQ